MPTADATRLLRGFAQTPHGSIEWRGMGVSGHPLVMFHSTPSSAYHFEPHFPLLAKSARVIAMSTPGYGESDQPPVPYTSIPEFAQTALWFLDAMELECVDLYGAWTGAQIATELAASHPDRVRRIVLEEPWDYGNPEGRALHETIHRYIPEQEDGTHLVELWKKYGGDRPDVDLEEFSRRFIDFLRANGEEETYGNMGREGAAPYCFTRYSFLQRLHDVQSPALVIHGSGSKLLPAHQPSLDALPHGEGLVLPSTGIFTPHDAPNEWAKAVLAFLDSTEGDS